MKLNRLSRLRYMNMLAQYLKKYEEEYSPSSLTYIRENFLREMEVGKIPDILMQIYSELHILPKEENWYIGFAKMIGARYGWNCHVLEIGGGFFPTFSKIMHHYQEKEGNGTITVYDPELVTTKLDGISLKKEEFQEEMSVESFDLLVGIMPCDATRLIIKKATEEHKEFFIAMCGCTHYDMSEIPRTLFGYLPVSYDDWVDTVYQLAKEQENDGFEVKMERVDEYHFPYPIISSRKK